MSDNGRHEMSLETEYATLDAEMLERDEPPGDSSPFSCPACGGLLWEVEDPELLRFRCRVGHAYTADAAVDGQGAERSAERFEAQAGEAREQAEAIRRLLAGAGASDG